MQIRICQVDPKDISVYADIVDLQKACLPGDDPYDPRTGYWWLVYADDVPIAFAGLVRSMRWIDTGYFCRAGVLPTYRGRGLQKKLIRARMAKAKKLGWNYVITDTTDNPASSNSLISCGFKLYEPSKPWGFKHTLYWVRRL